MLGNAYFQEKGRERAGEGKRSLSRGRRGTREQSASETRGWHIGEEVCAVMSQYCQKFTGMNSEQRLLESVGRMTVLIFENAVLGEGWAIKPIKCRWLSR